MAGAPAAFQSFEISLRIIAVSVAKKRSDTRACPPRKNLDSLDELFAKYLPFFGYYTSPQLSQAATTGDYSAEIILYD